METKLNYLFEGAYCNVYLVRHPEVENHEKNVFNGTIDVSLSRRGFEQLEILYRYFKDKQLGYVYSSPMKRCRMLAEKFKGMCKVVLDDRLRERGFGIFESMSWKDIEKAYPVQAKDFLNDPFNYRPKGGESFKDVEKRVSSFLKEFKDGMDKNVLIVAHGGVNRVIIMNLLGIKRENVLRVSQDYACINHFLTDGNFVLVKLLNGQVCF